jgi:hypothetical protein
LVSSAVQGHIVHLDSLVVLFLLEEDVAHVDSEA